MKFSAARRSFALKRIALLCSLPLALAAAQPVHQGSQAVWSAHPTTKVVSEEKIFANGGATLSGTLFRPDGKAKAPLVIVFHGASSPLRNEALYDHLKRMLPPLGIAVFAYDRRGTGKSEGNPKGNGYDLLADDGIAAAEMLSKHPAIDANRIGFWGLSQGGWLSLLAASRYKKTAFAVSISAPMVTPDVQMNFAVENILRIKGYPQEEIDIAISARKAVDDFQRGKLDRPTAQARLDKAVARPWFGLIYMDRTFSDPDKSGWAKEIRHDPIATIRSVTAPSLVLYGSVDPWVPAAHSVQRLSELARRQRNFEMAVVDGADHAMMTTRSAAEQIDPASFPSHAPNSSEYFGRLAAWLQRQGLTD